MGRMRTPGGAAGLVAWMIAERRPGSASWVAVMRMLVNPLASSRVRYSAAVRVPVVQPVCRSASARCAGSRPSSAMTSLIPSRPPGRSTRNASASTRGLSADRLITQLEMTTSTCAVGQRDVLDVAVQELRVGHPGLGGVLAGQGDHVRGAVQAVGLSAGGDAAGGQQHVDPAARTEVQHGLSRAQLGDGDGVAAAETGPQRTVGQFAGVAVPGGAEAARREGAGVAVSDLLPGACGPGQARVTGGDGLPGLLRIGCLARWHGLHEGGSARGGRRGR